MNGIQNGEVDSPQSTSTFSSRGRIIKPVIPYSPVISTPIPRTSISQPILHQQIIQQQQLQQPRASSSLNPNVFRPPPKTLPLSSSHLPVPPLSKISDSRYQAMYTTYPARMRLGTSSLMQPNFLAASGNGTNTPGPADRKRGRNNVNYAELEGAEDSELDGGAGGGDDLEGRSRRASIANSISSMVPKRNLGIATGVVNSNNSSTSGGGDKTIWGDGKSYIGVQPPGNLVVVQLAKPARHSFYSEDEMEEQAAKDTLLVPILIDIDVDTFKIRDAFVWNVNESLITPEGFARIFCDDLDLPHKWVGEVARQIKEQCEEQTGVAEIPVRSHEDELNSVEKDLRVILNLDVQIGTLHLMDRIEWDLSSPLTPELFATLLVRDLALTSSAAPLIAHALHEELFKHKKTCLEMGLVGQDFEGENKKRAGRMLEGVWREWSEIPNYGPKVEVLSLDEMDRLEADRERAIRRAKRDRLAGTGRRRSLVLNVTDTVKEFKCNSATAGKSQPNVHPGKAYEIKSWSTTAEGNLVWHEDINSTLPANWKNELHLVGSPEIVHPNVSVLDRAGIFDKSLHFFNIKLRSHINKRHAPRAPVTVSLTLGKPIATITPSTHPTISESTNPPVEQMKISQPQPEPAAPAVSQEKSATTVKKSAAASSKTSAYPAVQPKRAAEHFDEPAENFGEWIILLSGRAIRDFRQLKDRKKFKIVQQKLSDLSFGQFFGDNQKKLVGTDTEVPIYGAKVFKRFMISLSS